MKEWQTSINRRPRCHIGRVARAFPVLLSRNSGFPQAMAALGPRQRCSEEQCVVLILVAQQLVTYNRPHRWDRKLRPGAWRGIVFRPGVCARVCVLEKRSIRQPSILALAGIVTESVWSFFPDSNASTVRSCYSTLLHLRLRSHSSATPRSRSSTVHNGWVPRNVV